jgi:hypothetical protein
MTSSLALVGCKKVEFDVSPMTFSDCKGKSITAHLKWRVPGKPVMPINIYVADVIHAPTLWHSDGRSGEADAGNWIFDGTTFSLRDGQGNLLARRTITSIPCSATE